MTLPRFCDTHIHLTMKHYRNDLDEVLHRARTAGVGLFITMGLEEPRSNESWDKALKLALQHDDMKTALAIHPHDATVATEAHYTRFAELYRQHPDTIVAVGEAGLDYHYDFSPREIQQEVFRRHIRLAIELGLPLSVHSREAWKTPCESCRKKKPIAAAACFTATATGWKKWIMCWTWDLCWVLAALSPSKRRTAPVKP